MAKKKNEVPRDNVAKVTIGYVELQLEASLGTGITYSNEFRGKLEKPYKGVLADDMLHVWRVAQPTITETDDDGKEVDVENPDYIGYDVVAMLRIAWAMAYAAGSTKKRFDAFYSDIIHQPAGVFEEASLFNTVVMQLGCGIIFRRPTGLGGTEQADETQEVEEG